MADVTVQCRIERSSRLRLEKHEMGFITYTVEPGAGAVLILSVEERQPNTSVRLAKELVLEFVTMPPIGQRLDEKALNQALYKYGGPQLQFESERATGHIMITSLETDGSCHGTLDFTFVAPNIDLAEGRQARIAMQF